MKSRPSGKRPNKRRPYQGKARKESRLPLDDSFLVQRSLDVHQEEIAIAELKSSTRHPTVFRKRIAKVSSSAKHGDLVRVVDDKKETVGFGLWNPRSEATIRILSWGETPPDKSWWTDQLRSAIQLRTDILKLQQKSNAFRVINAEGDALPGLVADVFNDVLSVEVFTLGMFQRAQSIAQKLAGELKVPHWVVRTGPRIFEQEGFISDGFSSNGVSENVIIEENGIRYQIHPFAGHKTGFFCDQRENRLLLRQFCKGKEVLDACCYSGGFAINAANAGAKRVTGVDLDEEAVAFAIQNAKLNSVKTKFIHADAFSYMRDMQRNGKTFDVVVLDPPKLIRGRDEMHEGQNKYFDFNQLASSLVTPGGILVTCSCSGLLSMNDFTMTVRAATADRNPRILLRSGAGADHPVNTNCLDTEYLKTIWLQIQK